MSDICSGAFGRQVAEHWQSCKGTVTGGDILPAGIVELSSYSSIFLWCVIVGLCHGSMKCSMGMGVESGSVEVEVEAEMEAGSGSVRVN